MSSFEDISLAIYVVGLLIVGVFGALGELGLSLLVLCGVILVAGTNLLLRYRRTPDTTAERRKRILRVRDARHWLKLGVLGDSTLDEQGMRQAAGIIRGVLADLATTSSKKPIVVSGWVAEGVSLCAFLEAKALGLPTIGFSCKDARDSAESKFDCDEVYVVGRRWGEERAAFLTFVDGLLLIGGNIGDQRDYKQYAGPKWRFSLSGSLVADEVHEQDDHSAQKKS